MCGIAGVYYFNDSADNNKTEYYLERLLKSISHRGPDDQGYASYEACSIGIVRLSIIDIPTGHQPIFSSDGRYSIVYNGEIYNYQSIKNSLIEDDIKFETNSDTEVLLKGYIKYGKDVLHMLDGMFAFCIYDSKLHKLFIARDRLGKKPLYYYRDKEKLIFCSEVDAFTQLDELTLTHNRQAYWDYLTYRYIPGEETSYGQIKKFGRGQFSLISSQEIKTERYWNIPHTHSNNPPTANRFGELFADAVKKRLISDVPIGVMLSGGVDSCAVLYEASKHQKIDSYHVFFDTNDKDYNELKYAKQMAESVNSPLHIIEASRSDFYDQLANIAKITDEPLSDLAAIPFKMVCDLAVGDVKVALSGEGSDEILAGYGIGSIPKRLQRLNYLRKIPKPARKLLRTITEKMLGRVISLFDEVNFGSKDWAKSTNFNITYQIGQLQKLGLLNDGVGDTFLDSARFLHNNYNQLIDEDTVNQILHVISADWLEQDVLMKSDKVSMSSSLELRCPFLDHNLVEYLFGLQGKYKVGKLNNVKQSKILLKEYLHNKIPDELVFRKKLGFPVPSYDVKEQSDLSFIHDILSPNSCYYQEYFKKNSIIKMIDAIKNKFPDGQKMKYFLWSLVVYELWIKGKYDQKGKI
jgi:asparagine synthase (glutamine-hydrolysing)